MASLKDGEGRHTAEMLTSARVCCAEKLTSTGKKASELAAEPMTNSMEPERLVSSMRSMLHSSTCLRES